MADGHDRPRLIDELVPGVAAVIEDFVVGFEDTVEQPVIAHELPDVFGRIELGRAWRQVKQRDVVGNGSPVDLRYVTEARRRANAEQQQ